VVHDGIRNNQGFAFRAIDKAKLCVAISKPSSDCIEHCPMRGQPPQDIQHELATGPMGEVTQDGVEAVCFMQTKTFCKCHAVGSIPWLTRPASQDVTA
jgi:hypothetical protein